MDRQRLWPWTGSRSVQGLVASACRESTAEQPAGPVPPRRGAIAGSFDVQRAGAAAGIAPVATGEPKCPLAGGPGALHAEDAWTAAFAALALAPVGPVLPTGSR